MEGQRLRIKALERELHINHFHLRTWHVSGSLILGPRIREARGDWAQCGFYLQWGWVVAFSTVGALFSSWQCIQLQLILWTSDTFCVFLKSQPSHWAPWERGNHYCKLWNSQNCAMVVRGGRKALLEPGDKSYNLRKHYLIITDDGLRHTVSA